MDMAASFSGVSTVMFSLRESRRARVAAMVPVFLFLVAARTSVAPMPETLVGMPPDFPINESITVKEGDVVLRAKVFDTEVVTLSEPVSVAIAKFSHDIEAGAKLDPVIVSQQTEGLTGTSGRIYCGENQRTRSKFAEAMIGDMFSKYEATVRFCFVDTDGDRKLDRVFLAGAKDKADQAAIDIAPVAFDQRLFQEDDEAGVLELRVHRLIRKRRETDKIEFKLHLMKNGQELVFDYLLASGSGSVKQTYPLMRTDPKKVPYPSYFNNVLGAGVGVEAVDAEKGEAQIKITRNFPMQLFKPVSIQYTYVYIYY